MLNQMKQNVKYYNVVTVLSLRVMLDKDSMSIPELVDTSRKYARRMASNQYLIII